MKDDRYDDDVTYASYSQQRIYNKCKLKWQLRYRDKLKPPSDTVHTIGGTAFHDAVQSYLTECVYGGLDDFDLEEEFKYNLRDENRKAKEDWDELPENPATRDEIIEYYKLTCNVLNELKNNIALYFDPEYTELIGIEEPIRKKYSDTLVYTGALDVVLKDKDTENYIIIDLKTSTSGWNKWDKKDSGKINQLVAYKLFYSEKLGVPLSDIEIKYLICTREPDWNWTNTHIEEFSPKDDDWAVGQVESNVEDFMKTAFHFPDGEYTDQDFDPEPEKFTCAFCPYSTQFSSGEYAVCDQNGIIFDEYPKKMKNYIDKKWCK